MRTNREDAAPAAAAKKAWRTPRLRRLNAGAAENGLTPSTPDGSFSPS